MWRPTDSQCVFKCFYNIQVYRNSNYVGVSRIDLHFFKFFVYFCIITEMCLFIYVLITLFIILFIHHIGVPPELCR